MSSQTEPITSTADVIDSRDVIARIEYLQDSWAEATEDDHTNYVLSEDDWAVGLGAEDAAELVALLDLASDGETNVPDWMHGETLVRDSYFEDYARELADDIGVEKVSSDTAWPFYCIDWARAARELQADYTELDFDGVTYWARA